MSLILERLLVLISPLLAAAATGKKKTAGRPAKRSTARSKPARAATPRAGKAPTRAGRRGTARTKSTGGKSATRAGGSREKAAAPVSPAPAAPAARPPEPPPQLVPPTQRAILLAPQNGKFTDTVYPRFRWLSVGGATRYEVAWSEDPNFADAQTVISIATEAAVPLEKPLKAETTYYWRVRGGNQAGWGPWSPAASFRVLEETPSA